MQSQIPEDGIFSSWAGIDDSLWPSDIPLEELNYLAKICRRKVMDPLIDFDYIIISSQTFFRPRTAQSRALVGWVAELRFEENLAEKSPTD